MSVIKNLSAGLFRPYNIGYYKRLGSGSDRLVLKNNLISLADEFDRTSSKYISHLALYDEDEYFEDEFYAELWREISYLTSFDNKSKPAFSDIDFDNDNHRLSFKLSGRKFSVRLALATQDTNVYITNPMLVFNLETQLDLIENQRPSSARNKNFLF